jgi:hypothetical protein
MSHSRNEDALEHQAANTLNIEMIPGTDVMRDMEGYHFTHAAGERDAPV